MSRDHDPRSQLLTILHRVLTEIEGARLVEAHLAAHPLDDACYLVATGKAAVSMAQGAARRLGERVVAGLVITKHGHGGALPERYTLLEAGHPVPDAQSLAAGQALLDFIAAAEPGYPFLFLISGGTSALVESLPAGVSLLDMAAVNDWLLGSGLDIAVMNRIRKGMSCIKGGRLALRLEGRRVDNLLLSDVPGDRPAVIGSGLLVADEPVALPTNLPSWIRTLLDRAPLPPSADDPCFKAIATVIVGSNQLAQQRAIAAATDLGLTPVTPPTFFTGDALAVGRRCAQAVLDGPSGFYVWGGESTVVLPKQPGRGGRNQAMALAAAEVLAGRDDVTLLAVGTDGTDGPTEDAGGLVDGGTVTRGELAGFDVGRSLALADSGRYLEGSGDLVATGVTGTNVMDLVMAIKR